MLTLTSHIDRDVARLTLGGRFDFKSRKTLRDAYDPILADPAVRRIELLLSGVEYIDSSALGILLLLKERADKSGKKVILKSPQGTVAQVLGVANFDRLFAIVA